MSVQMSVFGSDMTLGTFVQSSYDGPVWLSLPIDAASSATQVTSTFDFQGLHVVATFTGAFGNDPSGVGTLAGIASSAITGFSVAINGAPGFSYTYGPGVTLSDALQADMGTNASVLQQLFSGDDVFIGSLQSNSDGDNDWVNGYAGNDVFYGNAPATGQYPDGFFGNSGIDTAVFRGNRGEYSIASSNVWMNGESGQGYLVTDQMSGRDGTTNLLSVERLQFANAKVALDTNAVQTMEFIGMVAPSLMSNLNVRTAILHLFDNGNSMGDLCQLALEVGLLPTNSTELATTIFNNVVGAAPSADMTNNLVNYINAHGQADFLATIAGMHVNVDVVGIAQNGMEYA